MLLSRGVVNIIRQTVYSHICSLVKQPLREYHFNNPARVPFSKSCDPRLARPKPDTTKLMIEARKKNLSQSVWKMGFVAKLIRGAWLPDALAQLKFSPKHKAVDIYKIVERAASLAKIKFEAIPEQLVVRECVINKGNKSSEPFLNFLFAYSYLLIKQGLCLKRRRIMGRGRTGFGYKRSSHVTVRIEKVDFQKEINNAVNPIQKRKWLKWQSFCNLKINPAGSVSNIVTEPTSTSATSQ